MQWLDHLYGVFDTQALVLLLFVLFGAWALVRIFSSDQNTVKGADFISSRGVDGKDHGDPQKLAKTMFIFAGTFMVGYTFWSQKVDNFYVVALYFGWAIAMLGIDVFAAWARSFVDRRFGNAPAGDPKPPQTVNATIQVNQPEPGK